MQTDVLVVGAGPCGLAVAIAAQRAGLSAVVFDRSCLVSSIALYPTYVTFFSSPDRLEIGGVPFVVPGGGKPTRRDGLAYYRDVAATHHLALRLFEDVERIEPHDGGFTVHSRPRGDNAITTLARAVVIATGYFSNPNMLGVPGEDLPHVTHRFVEAHEAFGRRALVVGGGNSAVECALDLVRSGAKPTLMHFGPTFDHVIKPWILPEFERLVADGVIGLKWHTRVTRIERDRVHVTSPAGAETIEAEHVYLLTGYTPAPGLLGALGVPFDAVTGVPAHDAATMETPVRGVYIAGVIASGNDANSVFIENGRDHGELIARALATK